MRNTNNFKEKIITMYVQGIKAQDIATKLNISLGSVKMCISRMKRQSGYVALKKTPDKLQKAIRKDLKDIMNELELPQLTKDFLAKTSNNVSMLALIMTEHVMNYLNNVNVIDSREERETVALKIKMLQVVHTMYSSNNNK